MDDVLKRVCAGLVQVTPYSPDGDRVHMPMCYPGGTTVTLHVCPIDRGCFRVGDFRGGYEEAEQIGETELYKAIAENIAAKEELTFRSFELSVVVDSEEKLAGALMAIACASLTAVTKTYGAAS